MHFSSPSELSFRGYIGIHTAHHRHDPPETTEAEVPTVRSKPGAGLDRLLLEADRQWRREAHSERVRIPPISGGAISDAEGRQVVQRVATAGFDPAANVPATGLSGQVWRGITLRGSDRITSGARHYLRHVVMRQEWPIGTTFDDYQASLRDIVQDPASGLLVSRYRGQWQLCAVRRSGALRGPGGFAWVLVEYRVGIDYWVTAHQLRDGLRGLLDPNREHRRWLRRPR